MDGDAFAARVEQMRAPTPRPGDLVICDNLSVHKNAKARAANEARGAELRFLPAYSPDPSVAIKQSTGRHSLRSSPIELVFAKLKARVRSAAARCADPYAAPSHPPSLPSPRRNARDTSAMRGMRQLDRHAL